MAQTQRAYLKAAEEAIYSENYYAALDYYLEAIEFDTTDIRLYYMAAESARNFDSYSKAEELYSEVLAMDSEAKYPDATFYLGYVQQLQGKYDQAKRNYGLYLSQFEGDNARLTARANKEIASIEWAEEMINNPEPSITVTHLGESVNTEFSEIGAIFDGDDIVYSSVQFLPKNRKKYSDKHISKVLSSGSTLENFEIAKDFNKPNIHTAHVTFNMNRSKMYYTVCEYINDDDIRCDLYCRAVKGDGTYGEETKLPAPINVDSFTNSSPI